MTYYMSMKHNKPHIKFNIFMSGITIWDYVVGYVCSPDYCVNTVKWRLKTWTLKHIYMQISGSKIVIM